MVIKGDTSPPSSVRKREKARLILLIFLTRDRPAGIYRRRDGGLAIASRCTRTPEYIFPTRPWRYYWHFVLPRSIRSLARFFPITSHSPATTRSYVCYSDWTQRVSERAVTLPVYLYCLSWGYWSVEEFRQVSRYIFDLRDDCTPDVHARRTHAVSARRNETPIGGLPALCAKLVAFYVICPLSPPHSRVYIRYPIVPPRVIVARDINADIRRGLANMSHCRAFLARAFRHRTLARG